MLKTGHVSATLLDGSSGMLDAAKIRLKDFKNVVYVQAGFQELLRKEVLHKNYDFIASSLAIHHLTMKEKKALFRKIYQHLFWEVVSTPDRIPLIIRYFQKTIVLIRKKPVNLAGVNSWGKNGFGTVRFTD
jgi:hypothetical protein